MGLAQALDYLESSVSAQLSWLLCRRLAFCEHSRFWQMLAQTRLRAMFGGAGGYSYFAGEPLLRKHLYCKLS